MVFVVTADQIGSRHDIDRAGQTIEHLDRRFGAELLFPADQTAGDEVQLVTASAATALALVLELTRMETWSVGLGCGDIRTPLPDAARKAAGSAFIAARDAVDAAKRADSRFALRAALLAHDISLDDVEPFLVLLLLLRARRTAQGWEVHDLLATGMSQKEAAAILGISPPAVSIRVKTAQLAADEAAQPALVRLLARLDAASTHNGSENREP